jgi:hypothetical protein
VNQYTLALYATAESRVLVALKSELRGCGEAGPAGRSVGVMNFYQVVHVERIADPMLPALVEAYARLTELPELWANGYVVVVDIGHVGTAFRDMLSAARPGVWPTSVIIEQRGWSSAYDEEHAVHRVGRKELHTKFSFLLSTRRIELLESLPLSGELAKQLGTFAAEPARLASNMMGDEALPGEDLALPLAEACWWLAYTGEIDANPLRDHYEAVHERWDPRTWRRP